METTTVVLEQHAEKLAKRVAEYAGVENASNRYADIHLKIGKRIFYCHKFVLQINSDYFRKMTFEIGTPELQALNPDYFIDVLRFMYTGELLVSKENIECLLLSADILTMCDLTKLCYRYMAQSLTIENALLFWRLAIVYEMEILARACQAKVEKDVEELLKESLHKSLLNASEDTMKIILGSDCLGVKHEEEAAELLIFWLNEQVETGHECNLLPLLHFIKWSGVSAAFVKSKMLENESIQSDEASMAFLARVISYLQTGIQFEGLQTFQRLSTGLENCLMTLGVSDGLRMNSDICRISLSHPTSPILTLEKVPTILNSQSAASTHNGTVYLTGTGSGAYTETWSWNPTAGWKQLADMLSVRRIHCSTFVDSTLFVLGGKVEGDEEILVLNSVESYNTKTNKWAPGGKLVHPVYNAASITYKNAICVFGGEDKDKMPVDHVQVYNTVKKGCALMAPMPEAYEALRAMLWETSVILLGRHTCYIYDFDSRQWMERPQFKTNVHLFAAALDNSTIFVVGGGTFTRDREGVKTWTYSAEIKKIPVMDIIQDNPEPEWQHHGTHRKPGMIAAFVSIALPVIDKTEHTPRSSQEMKKKVSLAEESNEDEDDEGDEEDDDA